MYDIITFGSATVDVFANTEHCETLKGRARKKFVAYPIGAKVLVKELLFTVGGGGTNTAVAFSRLGHKVAFAGKIGRRDNSGRVCRELNKEKVDTSLIIRTKDSRTGYSIILDSYKHDRTILTYRGSNSHLKFEELPKSKLKAKWFYFSSLKGTSFRTLEKLSSYARKHDIDIAFTLSSYLANQGKQYLKRILNNTSVLIMNKEEAALVIGKHTVIKTLKKLHALGPDIVAITDGPRGVHVFHDHHVYCGKPNNVTVVETTGAGDAFSSGFVSGIINGKGIERALQLGMTNAESVIGLHGAKNKLLTYKEAMETMKRRPITISKLKV